MKRLITTLTLLTLSTSVMAGNNEKRAIKAIETVIVQKVTEKVANPLKTVLIKRAKKFAKKFETKPTPTIKAIGGILKLAKEIAEPTLEVTTEDSKLKIKLLQFKSLKLDYKNKNNDLNLNFETDLKKTTLGLKMSF